jgi:hypothetical protein
MLCTARVPGLELFLLRRPDTLSAVQESIPRNPSVQDREYPARNGQHPGLVKSHAAASTAHNPFNNL